MVCEKCQLIFNAKFQVNGKPLLYTRRELRLKEDCPLCAYFARSLGPGACDGDEVRSQLYQWFYPNQDPRKDVLRYDLNIFDNTAYANSYILRVKLLPYETDRKIPPESQIVSDLVLMPADIVDPLGASNEIEASTSSKGSLDLVKSWLNDCIQKHKLCKAVERVRRQDEALFAPTRLIKIQHDGLHLVITKPKNYQYITLSHRWPKNGDLLLRLTVENLEQFESRIPDSQASGFSKTFADAVEVCRHIGVEYLWIDSLCIIQKGDNGMDWDREAVTMGQIYENSICNILAESASDGEEGLEKGMFRTRNPPLVSPIKVYAPFDMGFGAVDWRLGLKNVLSSFKNPQPNHYHILPADQYMYDTRLTSLLSRAWVVQEHLLAPRCLHFSKDKIYYECCTHIASETYPKGSPFWRLSKHGAGKSILFDLALRNAGFTPPTGSALEQYDRNPFTQWHRYVHWYSACGVEKAKDKLIAISGLARAMQPILGAQPVDYLAGIWRGDLITGLLWRAPLLKRPPEMIRSGRYKIPSWSWASVDWRTEINEAMHLEPYDRLIEITGVNVVPKSDPYGEIEEDAYLKIRGTTYGVRIVWAEEQTNYKPRPKFVPEIWIGTGKFIRKFAGNAVMPDERFVENVTPDTRDDLRVMPIIRAKKGNKWQFMEMLILEPVNTGVLNEYKRFGIMCIGGKLGIPWFELNTSNPVGKWMSQPKWEEITLF